MDLQNNSSSVMLDTLKDAVCSFTDFRKILRKEEISSYG